MLWGGLGRGKIFDTAIMTFQTTSKRVFEKFMASTRIPVMVNCVLYLSPSPVRDMLLYKRSLFKPTKVGFFCVAATSSRQGFLNIL